MSWKLMLVNGIVIAVVIWLTGVSVKDYACVTVGQIVGQETSRNFNEDMQVFLLRASFLAVIAAALIHYLLIRKLLFPLKQLTESTQLLSEGEYPNPITPKSNDEIGRLTRSFNHMTRTLQREEQNRKRLISNISHELRTPLSNLNGYLEALKDGMITGDRGTFASLHEESQYLIRLVEQLHQLSVLEAHPFTGQEKAKINTSGLFQQVKKSFQLESAKKGVIVHMDVQNRELTVHEQGITQILTNLLANALTHNIGNEVWIKGEVQRENYRISVTNIGEPIPNEIQDDVFERFVKADPARKRNQDKPGSGLGLAIVKEITEQHGGQAGLHSDGHKHTFWVTLPL